MIVSLCTWWFFFLFDFSYGTANYGYSYGVTVTVTVTVMVTVWLISYTRNCASTLFFALIGAQVSTIN
jgi:hypothetical protein